MRGCGDFTVRGRLMLGAAAVLVAYVSPAIAQTRTFNVPAGPAARTIPVFARQAGVQILASANAVSAKRTKTVRGVFSVDEALRRLLHGSGLEARATAAADGIITIGAARPEGGHTAPTQPENVPEILVYGSRNWSLNTGIQHTQDSPQPFQVFTQADIQRSGAQDLETFFRDFVTSNSSVGTGDQRGTSNQGRSTINLRGLGARETLILVDGRRLPNTNTGSGNLEQPSLVGIPLASIERIEVLPTSAAGLYGAGATGGVINIILRRDYRGAELNLSYADTGDFKAADKRIDLTVGRNIGASTQVSLTASYRSADPLSLGSRSDVLRRARVFEFGNDPTIFTTPPAGTTANIVSRSGNLRLKPQYGGTLLNSKYTFAPVGFQGVAVDGVAGLSSNAGQLNFDIAPGAPNGGASPLFFGKEEISGDLAVRHEFSSWLRVYAEVSGLRTISKSTVNLFPSSFALPATAPNNPFTQSITVTFPEYGAGRSFEVKNTQYRFVAGAVVQLPYGWRADIDTAYSVSRFDPSIVDTLDSASNSALSFGTVDILKDWGAGGVPYTTNPSVIPDLPNTSRDWDTTLKLAGPLPLQLPGGKPTLTMSIERVSDRFGQVYSFNYSPPSIRYTPSRSQTLDSVYGQLVVPLIGSKNRVPLFSELQLELSARYTHYKGIGADIGLNCYQSTELPTGPLDTALCDLSKGYAQPVASNGHIDPSMALRWSVTPDIAFRTSYATGLLTPQLNTLVKTDFGNYFVQVTDPLRGNEMVGTPYFGTIGLVPTLGGGNPDVQPQKSKTFSAGVILTPRFAQGLRVSVDYTQINERDVFFSPFGLQLTSGQAASQAEFEAFLAAYPSRVTRGPASGGYAVGPITSLDLSEVNLARLLSQAIDFKAAYARPFRGGALEFEATGTYNLATKLQDYAGGPFKDFTDVIGRAFEQSAFGNGSVDLRANGSVRWTGRHWSLGGRVRYYGSYYLALDHSAVLAQASNKVARQAYFDVFGSVMPRRDLTVQWGFDNVFGTRPPYDPYGFGGYSSFGDLRLQTFYLRLKKSF